MARHYSSKDFFRQMPNTLLARYFGARGLLAEMDFAAMLPAMREELDTRLHFEAVGVERKAKSSASPIRAIFKAAFEAAGPPYYNPHSLRSTLLRLGQTVCQTPEDFKAWSLNLGHEGVLTTFHSYGTVAPRRQAEIIQALANPTGRATSSADEVAAAVVRAMRQCGMSLT